MVSLDTYLCLFLDNLNKFLCKISVLNLNDGNVPKFHVRNIPNFEVGNVPNLKLGNCIQSIIMRPGWVGIDQDWLG